MVERGEAPGTPGDLAIDVAPNGTVCLEFYARSDTAFDAKAYFLEFGALSGGASGSVDVDCSTAMINTSHPDWPLFDTHALDLAACPADVLYASASFSTLPITANTDYYVAEACFDASGIASGTFTLAFDPSPATRFVDSTPQDVPNGALHVANIQVVQPMVDFWMVEQGHAPGTPGDRTVNAVAGDRVCVEYYARSDVALSVGLYQFGIDALTGGTCGSVDVDCASAMINPAHPDWPGFSQDAVAVASCPPDVQYAGADVGGVIFDANTGYYVGEACFDVAPTADGTFTSSFDPVPMLLNDPSSAPIPIANLFELGIQVAQPASGFNIDMGLFFGPPADTFPARGGQPGVWSQQI